MKLSTLFFLVATMLFANPIFAQDDERSIGAQSLTLNSAGTYEFSQKYEVANTTKKELYDRIKSWMVTSLKVSQDRIFFDDENNNSITATLALPLKDFKSVLTNNYVDFKIVILFKDNKVKADASGFMYHGIEPAAGMHQKPFENLKPFYKKIKRTLYTDFDEKFTAFAGSLNSAITSSAKTTDW